MAARARARSDADRVMEDELIAAARQSEIESADDVCLYEGTCDVCGQPISLRHSFTVDGIIDYGVDQIPGSDDYLVYTWIRHIAGPFPDCDRYSSRVYAHGD